MALPSERAKIPTRDDLAPRPFVVGASRSASRAPASRPADPAALRRVADAHSPNPIVAWTRLGVLLGITLLALGGLLPASNWPLLVGALGGGLALATSLVVVRDRRVRTAPVGHVADGLLVAVLTVAGSASWAAPLLPLALAALATAGRVGPRATLAIVGWDLWLFAAAALLGGRPLAEAATVGLVGAVVGTAVVVGRFRADRARRGADRIDDEALRPRLIAMLSHDLRTPLTSVKGFAQLIQRERALPESPRRYAEVIVAESNRAIRAIGDVVDLVQLQAGQTALLPSLVDLARVAANAVAVVEPDVSDSAATRLRVRGPLPLIRADAARLERVMVNLITTARRFVGDETPLGVEIAGSPSGVTVWIRLTDREVPTTKYAHIFGSAAPDLTADGEISGSGLGLYIAKCLIETHGGRFWVESADGRGTTFVFWLPA